MAEAAGMVRRASMGVTLHYSAWVCAVKRPATAEAAAMVEMVVTVAMAGREARGVPSLLPPLKRTGRLCSISLGRSPTPAVPVEIPGYLEVAGPRVRAVTPAIHLPAAPVIMHRAARMVPPERVPELVLMDLRAPVGSLRRPSSRKPNGRRNSHYRGCKPSIPARALRALL